MPLMRLFKGGRVRDIPVLKCGDRFGINRFNKSCGMRLIRMATFWKSLSEQGCLRYNLQVDQSVKTTIHLHEDGCLFRGDDLFKDRNVLLPRLCDLD